MHKSPYIAVLTWGAVAVALFLLFRVTNHTGLDAYFWLSPQGVIWIVLVQALTALSVFTYFRREHPSEQSWKTTVCAWLGFARPDLRARALLPLRDVRGRGHRALRQGALHDRLRDVLGAGLVARHHRRRRAAGLARVTPAYVKATQSRRSTRPWAASSTSPPSSLGCRGAAGARRPGGLDCVVAPPSAGCGSLRLFALPSRRAAVSPPCPAVVRPLGGPTGHRIGCPDRSEEGT